MTDDYAANSWANPVGAFVPDVDTPCMSSPELWFMEKAQHEAARHCVGCPVINACADHAMRMERGRAVKSRFGVWGGLLPVDRARMDGMGAA